MHLRCTICLEDIAQNLMATRCGHLYCTECATMNFNQHNAKCALCRRPSTFEDLIMLYPDYGDTKNPVSSSRKPSESPQAIARAKLDSLASQAIEGCHQALQRDDTASQTIVFARIRLNDLATALSALSDGNVDPTTQTLYQRMLPLLNELTMTSRPNVERLRVLASEAIRFEAERNESISQLRSANTRISELEARVRSLVENKQVRELRRNLASANDRISNLQDRVQALLVKGNQAMERVDRTEQEVRVLTSNLQRVKKSLAKAEELVAEEHDKFLQERQRRVQLKSRLSEIDALEEQLTKERKKSRQFMLIAQNLSAENEKYKEKPTSQEEIRSIPTSKRRVRFVVP
ncbi:hypothetical protein CERSUDRAFT_113096 [Gelatoporia subvermispora B]|uniref:RING-type domain-containing protein n=1 Tax=Ceriporiopsis subvermispora (strain B) TaxID=914234 RepID=M2R0D4_CERS8|nr:hypothetical protein CERSUDRAFT_113096 [Gelatoporia subvermispora B]